MRVIRLATTIGPDHKLSVQLPDDVGEGPAEVLVTLPGGSATADVSKDFGKFMDLLDSLAPGSRDQDEVDRALQAERDSWNSS